MNLLIFILCKNELKLKEVWNCIGELKMLMLNMICYEGTKTDGSLRVSVHTHTFLEQQRKSSDLYRQ